MANSDVRAMLANARSALASNQRLVEALEAALAAEQDDVGSADVIIDGWPQDADHPDLVDVATAAARASRSPDTIRTWCAHRGVGRLYGPRWRVSLGRLRAELQQ